MGNLFSSFDPQVRIFSVRMSLNWISATLPLLLLPQGYWLIKNQFRKTLASVATALLAEISAVFGSLIIPGTSIIFLTLFIFIVISNFMGLFPYVFTATRHFSLTLALSLPLWLGSIIYSITLQFNRIIAHLVPLGTPGPLIPVIVLIETVRSIIRPGTLAVRLAANIVAGHLLLTLLGGQGPSARMGVLLGLMVALVALLILECAVACIQAYVFTILRSLYLNELIRVSFNKANSYLE